MLLGKLRSNSGSGMIIAFFVLVLVFTLGLSFLSLASSSLITSKRDVLRARALAAAEAGIEQAITYLMTQGPGGEPNGTWRNHPKVNAYNNHNGDTLCQGTVGANETFRVCVRDGTGATTGKIIITSVGTVNEAGRSVSRTVKVVVDFNLENVCVWNNVIFGGVGQAGKSINGNVRMRGSVHLLGDGEKFTDVDNDGHWDDGSERLTWVDKVPKNGIQDPGEWLDFDGDGRCDDKEPFMDVNGNGTRDPALTVTDIAEEIGGTADVGNSYNGMPVGLRALIPDPPTTSYGGDTVETLSAKLRVKNGKVNISGSAVVGYPNVTGNTEKETMDGVYVSDGFGGNKGTAAVNSDNGYTNGYDLADGLVTMPTLIEPYGGYSTYLEYLEANATVVSGSQNFAPGTAVNISGPKGSFVMDANGNATISGIVYIDGDLSLGCKGKTIRYSGSGTLVASGNVYVHGDVLPKTKFPTSDALGLIARHQMGVATGGGDSQLTMALAMYAQEQITIGKQCEIAGTCVSSYFAMNNVPHIYQVPELANNLPPGLPGRDPIWIKSISLEGWQEI